jgi:putative ABC transport system substrate-binding protein
MRRREFMTLLGGATAAWSFAARAQQPNRARRVGVLIGGSENDPASQLHAAALREGLAKLGWMDGSNLRIELRFAAGDADHIRASAVELVSLAPEVIFVSTGAATRAVQQQTQTIPIVYTGAGDDIVNNSARPEGNITGFPILYPSIAGKWVELLREADPRVARVGLVNNPILRVSAFAGSSYVMSIEEAAPALAVKVIAASFHDDAELQRAINAFAAEPNGGLIVIPGTFTATRENRDLIRRMAAQHRLPTIHWDNLYPKEGGLMSYGSNFEDLHRRAASYVDRILRGAKVSELPVDRPTKFELIINVKAAKAIGLTIPEAFLLRADELIE